MKRLKKIILIVSILSGLQFIGCEYISPNKDDYSFNISENYQVYHVGGTSITDKSGNDIVEPNVIGVGWDERFIIINQERENINSYWIIDMENDLTYKNMSYEEFYENREELWISNELKLTNPNEFKYLDK